VPRRELAVIWDLAAAINVGSWAGVIVLELRQRHGIQVRMTALKPDDAVSLAAMVPVRPAQEPPDA
jgi:hypothetical protein